MKVKILVCSLILSISSPLVAKENLKPFKPEGLKEAIFQSKPNEIFHPEGNIPVVRIGSEGREESDTSAYPFTAVGLIRFQSDSSSYSCTGSMVAKNVVLTNGHCVWDQEKNKFYKNFKFFPAYQSGEGPLGEVKVKHVYVSTGYQDDKTDIDYGFLVLEENVGEQTGWFGTRGMKSSYYDSNRFYIAGYGSNYGPLSAIVNIQAVNKDPCQVTRQTLLARALVHNCDTGPGNSGSPLFTYVNGEPYVVGVHFSGIAVRGRESDRSCPESWLPWMCENYATKTSIFQKNMLKVIEENK